MKTLDEVIRALEVCTSDHGGCDGCPYDPDCTPDYKWDDAIFYLKEYRDYRNSDKTVIGNDCVSEAENNALTWQELNGMDGKPVWATFDNENGTWYIAKVYDDEVVLYEWGQEFGEIISGAWAYTPKRWQAYRKERV